VAVEGKNWLWNIRFGHLNFPSLKLLSSQVYGLPKVKDPKGVPEGCALRKHYRHHFPKGEA